MMTRLTSPICCLLLALALAPAPAEDSGSAVASGAMALSSAAPPDAQPDQRLPLSPVAARAGIIVVITGRNITIIKRDGSEVRVEAALAGETAIEADDSRPVILDGEAWVPPEQIPVLLGTPIEPGPTHRLAAAGGVPGRPTSFETFEVTKPVVSAPPPKTEAAPGLPRMHAISPDAPEAHTWVDVSPIEISLGLSQTTFFSDPGLRGICQEAVAPARRDPHSGVRRLGARSSIDRLLYHMSVEMADAGDSYAVGDMSDPLFGSGTGFRFLSPLSERTRAGASLVVPSALPGERAEGHLALTGETLLGEGLSSRAQIALDGSYYAAARWSRPSFALESSLLDGDETRREAIWWRASALPRVTAFGHTSTAIDTDDRRTSGVGLRWRAARLNLDLERNSAASNDDAWIVDSLSASWLRRGSGGLIRYLRPREGSGRAGLEWSLLRMGRSGQQLSLSSTPPRGNEVESRRTYRLSIRRPVGKQLRAQAALELGSAGVQPQWKVEWRPSRDQLVSLRYGFLDSELGEGIAERALVLQASIAFGGGGQDRPGIGRVIGKVTDDAEQGVSDIAVVLDGEEVALTRADGSYQFRTVTEGRHSIELDPRRVHAGLAGDARPRTAYVREDRPARVDFVLTRLCEITGRVYLQIDLSDAQEPLPEVMMELSTGERTATDARGYYRFAGLRPGKYAVSLAAPDEQPELSGLTRLPPERWPFTLRAGDRASGADFAFLRRARPIVFGSLGDSS